MPVGRKKTSSAKSSSKTSVKKTGSNSSFGSKRKIDEGTLNNMIRERAYYIWEEMGKPQGQDSDIWRRAEKDILAKVK